MIKGRHIGITIILLDKGDLLGRRYWRPRVALCKNLENWREKLK